MGRDDRLWLLQSRPVTAIAAAAPRTCLLGPGPIAETFPHPLSTLEVDLWLTPLREGMVRALRVTGAVSAKRIDESPVVTAVGGWAAVDLELLGHIRGDQGFWSRVAPRALVRHVGVAWRVGRTRVALPDLAAGLIDSIDTQLVSIPDLAELPVGEIAALMAGARRDLASVHALEVLAGMLLGDQDSAVPTGIVAFGALARARADGVPEEEIAEHDPIVLALTAPAVSRPRPLPAPPASGSAPTPRRATVADLGLRDALRLRTRWLQELLAVASRSVGRRLHSEGALPEAELVAMLTWDEFLAITEGGAPPDDLAARATVQPGPPLPEAFRLSSDGDVIAQARPGHSGQGVPAGGGRVVGEVRHRVSPGADAPGIILVTAHLEPQLAPLLPSLDGLVAETGSALSHLAILAREMGVPTVVGVTGALARFPPGTPLLVDGTLGEVRAIDPDDHAGGREPSGRSTEVSS